MKLLLFIILLFFTFSSGALIEPVEYNNYLIFSTPEYYPHSIPIKKQEISSKIDFLDFDRFIDGDGIIELNENKLISLVNSTKHQATITINYDKRTIFSTEDDYIRQLDIKFNDHNNIKKILSLDSMNEMDYSYDQYHRLIHAVEKFYDKRVLEFSYTHNSLIKSIFEKRFYRSRIQSKNIVYNYDNENKLISFVEIRYLSSDINKTDVEVIINCSFNDHNQYGDWTKSYCIKNNFNYMGEIVRILTY